jgi:DNA-binding response OmpR family regulator
MPSSRRRGDCCIWSGRYCKPYGIATRALIVDDTPNIAEPLALALGFQGLDARYVLDGLTAVEMLEYWHTDLIVLDISMPVHDGFQTARMMRGSAQGSNLGIVAYTALPEELVRSRAIESGIDAYCQKGASLDGLIYIMEQITRRAIWKPQ